MVDLYVPEDFYPAEIANDKIAEIDKWLKSTEPRKLDRVPIEADQLDADTVKKIEEAVAALPSNAADPYKPKRINDVPRQALLHPEHAEGRLQGQAFATGDRVVYVQNSGKVDIGMRGTVIGINISTIDVVFDATIMSGSTLGGRCSEGRGAIVPKSSVLNLSNPTVVAYSKAALQRKPEPLSSENNSRTASPANRVTRAQFNRNSNPAGKQGKGGNWYSPWGVNAPVQSSPSNRGGAPAVRGGSPFNPTMLLRKSQTGTNGQASPQRVAHQYLDGVAIPPPANLDPPRPRVRSIRGAAPSSGSPSGVSTPPSGSMSNGPRGGRGGRGHVRGGPINGPNGHSRGARGGRGRGQVQHVSS